MNRLQLWGNRAWWCLLGVLYGFFVYCSIFPLDGVPLSLAEIVQLDLFVPGAFLIPFFAFRAWKVPRFFAWLGSCSSIFLTFWIIFCIGELFHQIVPAYPESFSFSIFLTYWLIVQFALFLIFQGLGILCLRFLYRAGGQDASIALETPARSSFWENCASWGLTACVYLFFIYATLQMTDSTERAFAEILALGFLLALFFPAPYYIFRNRGNSRKISHWYSLCVVTLAALAVFSIPKAFPAIMYALSKAPVWQFSSLHLFLGFFALMYAVQIVCSLEILFQSKKEKEHEKHKNIQKTQKY